MENFIKMSKKILRNPHRKLLQKVKGKGFKNTKKTQEINFLTNLAGIIINIS